MAILGKVGQAGLKPQSRLTVSQWAELYRTIPLGTSPEPGRWNNSRTPYLIEPMDAFSDVSVEYVVCMMSSQVGKTEALLNVIGYYADQDPSPQLMVQPTDGMTEAFSKERVMPMFRESLGLQGKVDDGQPGRTASRKSSNTIRIKHYPGGYLAFASSMTAAGLATRPIRIALFDEIDRHGKTREGDPIKLGIQRTQNFYNRKIGIVSTPTLEGGSEIERWWDRSDKRRFWVPCVECGELQVLEWENVYWEKGQPETAVYLCVHCGASLRERHRNEMVQCGRWIPEVPGARYRGYHVNALYSPWVKFSSLALEWLEIGSDQRGKMEFWNLKLGLPWKQAKISRKIEFMMERKDDRPRGVVPSGISGVVAGVDVQEDGFWYEIRAFGKGHVPTTYCIREGFIPVDWVSVTQEILQDREYPYHPAFDSLREVLWGAGYKDPSGEKWSVSLVGVDSGHRTTEVYDFCRFHLGQAVPLKGVRTLHVPYKFSNVDFYPGSNKPIPGALKLCRLDVTQYKDRLASALAAAPDDPGAFLFHGEFPEGHAEHYLAEYKNDKGFWECMSGKPNHLWDASGYSLCMADVLGLRFVSDKQAEDSPKPKPKPKPINNRRW